MLPGKRRKLETQLKQLRTERDAAKGEARDTIQWDIDGVKRKLKGGKVTRWFKRTFRK